MTIINWNRSIEDGTMPLERLRIYAWCCALVAMFTRIPIFK